MRKRSRFLSLLMAISIMVSSICVNAYGMEASGMTVSDNELSEETSDSETEGNVSDNELDVEISDSETEEVVSDNESEEVISDNEPEVDLEPEENAVSENNIAASKPTSDKTKNNDLLKFTTIEVDWEETEDECYAAEDLYALAENNPSILSESHGDYWDNYSSYYIYNQLNDAQKKFWVATEVLCNKYLTQDVNLSADRIDYVTVSAEDFTLEELMDLATIFKYSHPQYYYLMSGFYYGDGGSTLRLAMMVYDAFLNGADRRAATNTIQNLLNVWESEIDACTTEEKKVRKIHDLICNKVDYNHYAADIGIQPVEQQEFTQSAYSVFCKDLTVCAGYTQAFMWLCNGADIQCFGVTSPGHAWNKVNVNDNWYNMDATWNDGDGVGNITYWCYLKSDAEIDAYDEHNEHNEEDMWYGLLPVCTLDSGSTVNSAKNPPTVTDRVAIPVINVTKENNTYTIQMSTDTPGAVIYYTLDGRTPSEGNSISYIYKEPITVTENKQIKAVAVLDRYLDSEIAQRNCESVVKVSYVTGTDQVIEEEYYKEFSKITEPVLNGKEGYTFAGWYTSNQVMDETTKWNFEEDVVTGDTILYAKWNPNTYKVTFQPGRGQVDVTQKDVVFDQPYGKLPIPVLTGYTFVGWYTDLEEGVKVGEDTTYMIADHSALYAKYEANTYTVTFDANGGRSDITEKEVRYEESYGELPIPILAGGEFLGWYTQKEGGSKIEENTKVMLLEDQILYAHWNYAYTTENPTANIENDALLEPGTRILLSTKTYGAKIYYTTDSNIGAALTTENGVLYEDAIIAEEDATIYAIAVKDRYNKSSVMTVSYKVRDTSGEWGDVTGDDRAEAGFAVPTDIPQELWAAGITDSDYTGEAIVMGEKFHVYHHKTLLKEKTDYTIKYKNNTKAGVATITITGKGNYTGSIVKTFIIHPLDIKDAFVQDITLAYNGKVQKGTTTVTYLLGGKTVTLKKGTDFTYEYPGTDKKAEDYDEEAFLTAKEHEVTIVGKGNYTGTTTFVQEIVEEYVIGKMTLTKIPKQAYTGTEIEPGVVLKNGQTTLEEGIHYDADYDHNVEVGTATVTITGIRENGYVGTRTTTFQITGTPLNKMKMEGFVSSKPWDEAGVEQEEVTFSYTTGKGKEEEKDFLEEEEDYTVKYVDNKKIGTATVYYTGIGGYTGTIKKTYKITGVDLKKVEINGIEAPLVYDGREMVQDGYELIYTDKDGNEDVLEEDQDYIVTYKNHAKAGKATITFKGIHGYTGTVSKTYAITAYDINDVKVKIASIDEQAYTKDGVTPKPSITFEGDEGTIVLEEGKDYTLKYSNNKAPAKQTDTKPPTITITGKNGFGNKANVYFDIVGSDLNRTKITATDVVWQNKANICKPVITLTDSNGKKLKAGTDYDKTIEYTYVKDVEVTQVVNKKTVYKLRKSGDAVDTKDIIPVDTEILATVMGIKNYAGTQEVVFRYVAADIAKATVTVKTQIYEGKDIKPNKNDITVKLNGKVIAKTDYEIVNYNNNLKKGNGKITIEGRGNYGGQKTVTFKINAKSMKDMWERLSMLFGW